MRTKELNYLPVEGESLIIENSDVKDFVAVWQQPIWFKENGLIDLDRRDEDIVYTLNYQFNNKACVEVFAPYIKKKDAIAMLYHLAGNKVTVYEYITVRICNTSAHKLKFTCKRWFNISLSQYREIKIEAMGELS